MRGRQAIGTAEPPTEMALVGKTEGEGDVRGRVPFGQQLTCPRQAQLDEVRVWRQAERLLEGAGELEATCTADCRQIIQAYVFIGMGMQILSGADCRERKVSRCADRLGPPQMLAQPNKERIQCSLADYAQLIGGQRCYRMRNGQEQFRALRQRRGEARRAMVQRCIIEAQQCAFEPGGLQIEHGIGESALRGGIAVVDFPGFEQKDLSGRAVVDPLSAFELLHALLGEANQIAFVPVRIVSMPFEVRAQRLNAGVGILVQ